MCLQKIKYQRKTIEKTPNLGQNPQNNFSITKEKS